MRDIKFRAWLTLSDYDEDDNDVDYHAMIPAVSVHSDGGIGFSVDEGYRVFDGDVFERALENGNVQEYEDWCYWDNKFALMQYIGLRDKNGVEIFEGDVLSHYDKHYVVKWDVYMAAFQTENIKDSVDSDFFNWGNTPSLVTKDIPDMGFGYSTPTCEVIGNIYEHPDLLSA